MGRGPIRIVAVAAVLVLAFAATAAGKREVVRVGNLVLSDNGGIFPSKLPRHGTAPISARIEAEIGTADGTHPPAIRSVDLDVDKTIQVDATGLPVCKLAQIASRDSRVAKQACGAAIVGSGEAEVEVSFPEQAPFSATGPITVFNGGTRGGTTTVLLHAYVNVPAPTAIVVAAKLTSVHRDRYGMHIAAQIPRIAGGAGSVTSFTLKIDRKYTYKGEKRSFLSAGCPTGSYATQGEVLFADGSKMGLTHVFPCTPEG